MTIQEAAKTWGVKEHTVFDYILKGYIYNLSIEKNAVQIPNIPKPYIHTKPKTVQQKDKYILTAMNKGLYVNAKIMGVDQEEFTERLIALIKGNRIFPKDEIVADYSSNLPFALSSDIEKNVITITNELNLNFEAKIADQIGLVNGKIGVNV